MHEDSAETLKALEEKHLQMALTKDDFFAYTPPKVKITPFTKQDVRSALWKTKKGTAPRGTGLQFDHIKDLCKNDHDKNLDVYKCLAQFATIVAKVDTCPSLGMHFASAPIIPLIKNDNDVRPIAIGDTLRGWWASY